MASVFKKQGKGPWIIRWHDIEGRLNEKSSRTTDKRAADRIASEIERGLALRRDGVIDPKLDKFAQAGAKPLREHIDAYIVHLEYDHNPRSIADATAHMAWIVRHCKATRLSDLTLDAVERALKILKEEKKAPRTINHRGGSVRAFLEWCVDTNRLPENPLKRLVQKYEDADRRRVRRPLTDEELARLFDVAARQGRTLWYSLAYYAGFRLSDLKRLRWESVDLEHGVLNVSNGKAKRPDEIPMHPALHAELKRLRPSTALPMAPVFPTHVTNETRRKDYQRAQIPEVIEEGYADLHALRTTLATNLARQGVAPQVAQKLLRHSRYSTTLKFYTRLGLVETKAALALISIPGAAAASPHHSPHQSQHVEVLSLAK